MARRSSIDPLFDEEPQTHNWMRYALIGGIVVIVGFILYAALAGRNTPQGPVPVVRADATPWTRAATETGGMEIPNQDSTVFELMDKKEIEAPELIEGELATEDKSADKTVDEVVSEAVEGTPEESATAETVIGDETKKSDVIGGLIDETTVDETADKPEDKTADVSEDKGEEKPVEKTEEKVVEKTAPKVEDEPYNPNAPKAAAVKTEEKPAAKASGKTVQVRLGSVPGSDKGAAAGEFNRLKGLAGGGLSGASPSYEAVTLDGKGSFVRINVSMDSAAAAKLCDTLSAKGAPCLVLGQ